MRDLVNVTVQRDAACKHLLFRLGGCIAGKHRGARADVQTDGQRRGVHVLGECRIVRSRREHGQRHAGFKGNAGADLRTLRRQSLLVDGVQQLFVNLRGCGRIGQIDFLHRKGFEHIRQSADVVLMRVRGDDHIQLVNAERADVVHNEIPVAAFAAVDQNGVLSADDQRGIRLSDIQKMNLRFIVHRTGAVDGGKCHGAAGQQCGGERKCGQFFQSVHSSTSISFRMGSV